MIRVTILYPNQPGSNFDHKYFTEKHLPLAKELLGPLGLVRIEVDKGISAPDPKVPAPFVVIAHDIFNSVDDVHSTFKAVGRQLMADISNFTNAQPQVQISEMIG